MTVTKKFSAPFILAAAFALAAVCIVRPVWALSDADYKQMLKSSPPLAAADTRLNKAWKALGEVTAKEVMSGYRDAQKRWNSTARDELVRQIAAVGEAREFYSEIDLKPVLKNGAVDRGLAYAKVTEERAMFLEELAKQQRDKKYVTSYEGTLGFSHGAYTFKPEGWWSEFIFCWASGEFKAADDAARILEAASEPVKVKVSGRLEGGFSDGEDNLFGFVGSDALKVEKK